MNYLWQLFIDKSINTEKFLSYYISDLLITSNCVCNEYIYVYDTNKYYNKLKDLSEFMIINNLKLDNIIHILIERFLCNYKTCNLNNHIINIIKYITSKYE